MSNKTNFETLVNQLFVQTAQGVRLAKQGVINTADSYQKLLDGAKDSGVVSVDAKKAATLLRNNVGNLTVLLDKHAILSIHHAKYPQYLVKAFIC